VNHQRRERRKEIVMKRMMMLMLALTMVFGLAALGQAENVAEGVVVYGTGGLGSFFAPDFQAEKETMVYEAAQPTNAVIRAADCCVAGDKYKLLVKGADYKQKVIWTSSGSLKSDCVASSTMADQVEVHHSAAEKIKMKAVALPGGIPATAYVTMEGSWAQTKGADACGF
jgi:hypothetical protein